MIAARICADHFDKVILVDPEFGQNNTRVPQINAAHGYLPIFLRGLSALWPDFEERVVEAGGRSVFFFCNLNIC